MPHGAVRLYVMGERGADREEATPDEIAEMGAHRRARRSPPARSASPRRAPRNHRTSRGEPTPTLTAAEDELVGIAAWMASEASRGVSDFADLDHEFAILRRMVEVVQVCKTFFGSINSNVAGSAKNIPEYSYTWTSSVINESSKQLQLYMVVGPMLLNVRLFLF